MESNYRPGQLICLKLIKGLAIQFITLKENRYIFQFQVSIGSEIFFLQKNENRVQIFFKKCNIVLLYQQ